VFAPHAIRIVGDPVLRQRAEEVTDIDERLVRLVDDMFTTMYDAPGVGLAAPQVGVQKRFFIYDLDHGDGQQVLINPVVEESDGEWEFTEGCLSIPGLHFDIVRPRRIHVTGVDLEGREVSLEAVDHLDGVLMLERLDEDQRKAARRAVRQLQLAASEPEPPVRGRFSFGRS
jgi:peptide deformylase